MTSLDLDQVISPIPRSREENQERAFIAASRRKDRSLDARLESANRASMLHKKRTGRAFHITKEIVEKEDMYEEVDERYQEKRIRMLHAQNMHIDEQFHRHLLAAFTTRTNGSGLAASSIARQRASVMPRASIDSGSSCTMRLGLSNLQSPFPQGVDLTSLVSSITTSGGYVQSPTTTFDSKTQSYMPCIEDLEGFSLSNLVDSGTTVFSSAQIAAYDTNTPAPTGWSTQMAPSWAAKQQHVPTPTQIPTDSQEHISQQQMMQQTQMSTDVATAIHMRQFRDRLASAPELSVQHIPPPTVPAASVSGLGGVHGHSRCSSEPSNISGSLQVPAQGTYLAQMAPSSTSSPEIVALSAETEATPDFCSVPNAPLSPTTMGTAETIPSTKEGDEVMVSHGELDLDFNEFSELTLALGHSSLWERERFGFDEFVALDDISIVPYSV